MNYRLSWTTATGEAVTNQIFTSEFLNTKIKELENSNATDIKIVVDCNITKYALKAEYQHFIDSYDPYNEDKTPEDLGEMLYNLQEIKKDLEQFPEMNADDITALDDIIEHFHEVGIIAEI